jgi:prepilin-type N-terminal cleavage/methylation domain-containing protein
VNRRGFTLTEVLVVISIIVVLTALLVPVTRRAMRQAHLSDGWSRMRQTAVAILIYQASENDVLPSSAEAFALTPEDVRCHPLDKWDPGCRQRQETFMVGSWGYAPSDPEPGVTQRACLLVNVFAGEPALSPVYTKTVNLNDTCIMNETCMMPDRLEYIGLDGALKIDRDKHRPRFTPGPYVLFGWGLAFDRCHWILGDR